MADGRTSSLKNFLAGGVGGVCLVFAGHPMDTIKVRLQTQPTVGPSETPRYKGTLDCAKTTIAKEGVFGLYRGMATPIFMITPMCSMSFFGYSVGRKLQKKYPNDKLSHIQTFKAGMISGLFQTLFMVPADRIKCLLQVQEGSSAKAKYKGPIDCIKKVFKERGITGIYKGTGATLLRDLPGIGMYFLAYEVLLNYLTPEGKRRSEIGPLKILLAGGCAGMAAWTLAIAPDTLKSRLQTAPEGTYPNGIRDVFKKMMYQEGPKALFKGLTPIMLRAFPANAACFLGYEMAMKFLNWSLPSV